MGVSKFVKLNDLSKDNCLCLKRECILCQWKAKRESASDRMVPDGLIDRVMRCARIDLLGLSAVNSEPGVVHHIFNQWSSRARWALIQNQSRHSHQKISQFDIIETGKKAAAKYDLADSFFSLHNMAKKVQVMTAIQLITTFLLVLK